ncbi:MAG: SUMF1/EgtB/PvdO family nonheme iron enzyme [Chitinispirillaceae bacterium]|nr:SUMF1/EgtB/PvdO family nonheme iron enzyme [Chitinispirillaceae bacterium]
MPRHVIYMSIMLWGMTQFRCMPRDNPFDPENPDFVMPRFSCTIRFRDDLTATEIVEEVTVIYSYGSRIDTAIADSGGSVEIAINDNIAAARITALVYDVTAPAHRLDRPFDLTLSRDGRDTMVLLHSRSARPVQWDTSRCGADTAGIRLVWHASGAEQFVYYRLIRRHPASDGIDTVAVSVDRRDTVFFDHAADEHEVYAYRIDVVATDGMAEGADDYMVKVPNRPPAVSRIGTIQTDFFVCLRIRWLKNSDADFMHYTLYRGEDLLRFDSVFTCVNRDDTVWLDTTIDRAARRYYYYLVTVDSGGLASKSAVVSQVNSTTIERSLVYVHEGTFTMGRNGDDIPLNQQPAHAVTLSSFLIDRHEVTVGRYAEFLNDGNGINRTHYCDSMAMIGISCEGSLFSVDSARIHHPMVWLSWTDADTFCRWAGGRLPTEAEWEKAARGSDARLYPWGNSFYFNQHPTDFFLANYIAGYISADDSGYSNDGARYTAPVGNYASGVSPFGLFDMAGNISEWCFDWYANVFPSDTIDPKGPELGLWRSYRGGSYKNYPEELMATYRFRHDPSARKDDLGCRCAYDSH